MRSIDQREALWKKSEELVRRVFLNFFYRRAGRETK